MFGAAASGILLAVAWGVVFFLEGEKPQLEIDLATPAIGISRQLSVSVADHKSGLRKLWIGIYKDGKETTLLEETYPGGWLSHAGRTFERALDLTIEPRKLGLSDGEALLRMVVRDFSLRAFGHGNKTYIEKAIHIDTVPPDIDVLSKVHNLSLGGTGLAIYRLSEACPVSGVVVNDKLFPGYAGYFKDPTVHMAFLGLSFDDPGNTDLFIQAVDAAGNVSKKGFYHYIRKVRPQKDDIRLSDRFLQSKMPEFESEVPAERQTSLLDRFLYVNGAMRQANAEAIAALTRRSENVMYWKDAFVRMPQTARQSSFADRRTYWYNGKIVDRQNHMGIDLAAVAHATIPAANHGKVVFNGTIGIYGKTIIVDHGFGLFSLYSHLSSTAVETGQEVSKGEPLGRTGMTGMAGGDHLHFSMIVGDTFVNPVEWWDAAWIRNNITDKIAAVEDYLRSE